MSVGMPLPTRPSQGLADAQALPTLGAGEGDGPPPLEDDNDDEECPLPSLGSFVVNKDPALGEYTHLCFYKFSSFLHVSMLLRCRKGR